MDRILSGRLKLDVDEQDREPKPAPTAPVLSRQDLIERLRDVQGAIAGPECDLQPPARFRHLQTIDFIIAQLMG